MSDYILPEQSVHNCVCNVLQSEMCTIYCNAGYINNIVFFELILQVDATVPKWTVYNYDMNNMNNTSDVILSKQLVLTVPV